LNIEDRAANRKHSRGMIRSFAFTTQGKLHSMDMERFPMPTRLSDTNLFLWIDLEKPSPEDTKFILEDLFHFHPLSIEDCVTESQSPKVEEYAPSKADDKFAVTLNNFGFTFSWIEQAEFRFYKGGALVGSPVVKQGCQADGSSTLASFSITPPGQFDRVEIRPQNTNTVFGFTLSSSFIVSEVATCSALVASCKTQLDTVANECP